MCVYVFIGVYIYICMCVCTCTYREVYMCTCTCRYVCMYVHMQRQEQLCGATCVCCRKPQQPESLCANSPACSAEGYAPTKSPKRWEEASLCSRFCGGAWRFGFQVAGLGRDWPGRTAKSPGACGRKIRIFELEPWCWHSCCSISFRIKSRLEARTIGDSVPEPASPSCSD